MRVMATFKTSMPGKKPNHKDVKGYDETEKREISTQAGKNISIELPELEKIPRNRRNNKKNTASTKEAEAHEKMDTKVPADREKAAAAEANRTPEEAGAQEIERRSMKSCSMVANRRGVSALSEHRRQDGWTSTPCTCSSSSSDSGDCDEMAGERLPKQRPHLSEETKDEEEVCLTTAKKR